MIKRALIILSLFLLPGSSYGLDSANVLLAMAPGFDQAMVGGSGGTSCDDCSGATMLAWHCEDVDVTADSPCGCSDGDSTASATNSPAVSGTQYSDGNESVHINSLDEDYSFTVSSDDIINMDDVKITFDIYIVSFPSAGKYIEIFRATAGAEFIVLILHGTNSAMTTYHNGGTNHNVSVSSVSTGSWISCEYKAKWNNGSSIHKLTVGGSSDEDTEDFGQAVSATALYFGDKTGYEAGEYYIDNINITVSGY